MALTSILAPVGKTSVFLFNRGNVGVLVDVVAKGKDVLALPALGGVCDYPSENDVRLGVTFDTFTGNLELPVEADVLLGVQYGAGGVEFTGEAVAGGGGSEEIIYNLTTDKLEKRLTDKVYMDL